MAEGDNPTPTLGEAARQFLSTLSAEKREASQPEVFRFARWYGWESPFSEMAPPAVASYAEQLSASDTDYSRKLQIIRSFLAYAKKAGWSHTNLATHMKTKKPKTGTDISGGGRLRETVSLTRQRYEEMQAELAGLKKRSRDLIGEIQLAAADKDFRENAPLAAAREERGHVEGRIKELEEALKLAVIIDEKKEPTHKAGVGDSVVIRDLSSGEETCYMIVDPREVDVIRGKISLASPLGRALIGRNSGETVEISAPAGKIRYEIKRIEH
jgi:transcription elongation factor GreA